MQLLYNTVNSKDYNNSTNKLKLHYGIHNTIFGKCLIACNENVVYYLAFVNEMLETSIIDDLRKTWYLSDIQEDLAQTKLILAQIFSDSTSKLSICMKGTEFQLKVWRALLEIPRGTTVSYQDIANKLLIPKSVRAVANAIGANNISYIVPCHRVISISGSIGGYRWGKKVKASMLKFENTICPILER